MIYLKKVIIDIIVINQSFDNHCENCGKVLF